MKVKAELIIGDNRQALKELPDASVQTVVTSPPYWGLRDYGHDNQIGLEQSPDDFIEQLCVVFDEVWRVLKDDGTIWVNLGDSYSAMRDSKASPDSLRTGEGTRVGSAANRNPENLRKAGLKHKDLVGIPWRFAFAMQARGWYLRSDIIWHKPNPMPESVQDRCTKAHEYIFLLSKSHKYHYDHEAIKEEAISAGIIGGSFQGRQGGAEYHTQSGGVGSEAKEYLNKNKRSVWTIPVKPYEGAHFAVFPQDLIEPCILAGAPIGGIVLDPFMGSGTTAQVAQHLGRQYLGCELNPEYKPLQEKRLRQMSLVLE